MFRWIFLLVGLGLLGWILAQADFAELGAALTQIGWGALAVLAVYAVSFLADTVVWLLTIRSFPVDLQHFVVAFRLRMVGEFFNVVTPLGGMGGEPVKAMLLKNQYGVALQEGTASVILYRTLTVLVLVVFLGGGLALAMQDPAFPAVYQGAAFAGLIALSVCIVLFFLVQRYQLVSLTGGWLSSKSFGQALNRVLHHIQDIDERLLSFYTQDRGRLLGAFGFAALGWSIGILEIYVAMLFLGQPVSLWEAWIIEAAAQLVRAGTFFIPASLGAQDGALMLVASAMTGQPTTGLAMAVVRRLREIVWLLACALVSWGVMGKQTKPSGSS